MSASDRSDVRSEKEIFFAALDHPTAEARAIFLEGACGKNPALRQRVEKLLADHFEADSFLQAAAIKNASPEFKESPMVEGPGTQIGRYKLQQRLGEGGFGIVYMAEQKQPVKRRVALKIIKLGMDTEQVVARFEAERQALAMMEHPNIARVLDGGATETGRPYFVMELVKGVPITKYCDDNELTTRERLELFIPVCQAIQHAHQKGIIHRDIKPNNIMITLHDGKPAPKVIDFGIAKATQQELTEKTIFTQYSQFIGTPAYMSPEQAEMSGLDIDTRTDIYSLGVLLYALLVGCTPLDSKELMTGGYDEIRRRIKELDPPKPSTKLSTYEGSERTSVAKQRKIGINQLTNQLKGDLDWIVLKSLEKDRTRRYETANGFALDIQRFLNDEPVSAVAPSLLYKCRKFARRNKLVFGAAAAITVALLAGLGLALVSYAREREARLDADANRNMAVTAKQVAEQRRLEAERLKEEAELARKAVESLSNTRRKEIYQSDMLLASQAYHAGTIERVKELVEKHAPKPNEEDLRGFEWYHWKLAGELPIELPNAGGYYGFQYSPLGQTFAVAGYFAEAPLLLKVHEVSPELNTIAEVRLETHIDPFSHTPDGASLVIGDGRYGGIDVLDTQTWTSSTHRARGDKQIRCLAFSSQTRLMATGGSQGQILLWDTSTWKTVGEMFHSNGSVMGVGFAPDGNALVATTDDHASLVVWDLTDPKKAEIRRVLTGHGDRITCVATCPMGAGFATGSDDKTVRLWNWNYELLGTYDATGPVTVLRFSKEGQRLAAGTDVNYTVQIWDVRSDPLSLKKAHTIKGHSRQVSGVDFSPIENEFVSVGRDREARVWNLDRCEPYVTLDQIPDARRICYTETSDALLVVDSRGKVFRWDLQPRAQAVEQSPQPSSRFKTRAISDGGAVYAGINENGFVAVWDSRTEKIHTSSQKTSQEDEFFLRYSKDGLVACIMVVSQDGSTVAWMTAEGIHVWNWKTNQLAILTDRQYMSILLSELYLPVLSFEGNRLVLNGTEYFFGSNLWDVTVKPPRSLWPSHVQGWGPQRSAAFSRDGTLIAIGSYDTKVRVYDPETATLIRTLKGHSDELTSVSFSSDGTRLASIGQDNKLCLWDVETGGLLSTLHGDFSRDAKVTWSPKGNSIAALGREGKVRVWISALKQDLTN